LSHPSNNTFAASSSFGASDTGWDGNKLCNPNKNGEKGERTRELNTVAKKIPHMSNKA